METHPLEAARRNNIMTNPTEIKPQPAPRDPMDLTRVAYLRIINDLIIIVLTLFLIFPSIDTLTAWIVIITSFGILFSSLISLVLINRGRLVYGLGLLIYGLSFGFFINALLIDGWGIFSLFFIVLFTLVTATTSISQKRTIETIVINSFLGIASFAIDIVLKGADFRIAIPPRLLPLLWMLVGIMLIINGTIFYRRFPFFTLRAKLITSYIIVILVSLGIMGLLLYQRIDSIFIDAIVGSLTQSTIIFSLVSVSVAIVIAIGFAQILTRPIKHLIEAGKEINQGNFDARIDVTSTDEIGELSKTFNNIVNRLQTLIVILEDQVAARTLNLENKAGNLQAAAEISRAITIEYEMSGLLDRAVTLISERFDLYHVGIYIIDPKNEFAVLIAGNDVIGKQLVENQHKYRIASDSNVGMTCLTGEPMLAPNAEGSTQISYHPLLPNTGTQMVLPLRAGDQLLGVVDLHSIKPEAFQQSDIPIVQTMLDQLANAIQKINYLEEIQSALEEQETIYGLSSRESWRRFIQGKEDIKGYRYAQNKVEPATTMPPEVIEAWTTREAVSQEAPKLDNDSDDTSNLAIPLKIRGEVIGVLNLQFASKQVPTEINNFIQELANRFSLVLENARLVEVAQRRVEREHLTSEITNKIRQTLDMDSVLRTAVQEIGETLDLAEVEVQMGDIFKTTLNEIDRNSDHPKSETEIGEA